MSLDHIKPYFDEELGTTVTVYPSDKRKKRQARSKLHPIDSSIFAQARMPDTSKCSLPDLWRVYHTNTG